jgi:hydrogenase-4 membrane subunit HyfE
MSNNRPEPNTELAAGFEPLRVAFALGALLLGFLVVFLHA